ncbi:hypothetical protein ACFVRV_02200 [Arthrobacter koreensis]|uniref:hypothetical protein n=1 Tax=Arthrobacter koreensis TaxID=199136 RepID=UPI0036D8AE86
MRKLSVRIRYQIKDLWIHPDLLGWTHRFKRENAEIQISFPESSADFSARPWETELADIPSVFPVVNVYDEPEWDSRTAGVKLICVDVVLESQLPDERPENPFSGQYGSVLSAECERATKHAEAFVGEFLGWIRALSRQPWLGMVDERPRQYGRAGIFDAESGESIGGVGPQITESFISSRKRMSLSAVQGIAKNIEGGAKVPVAQALLADSWHLTDGAQSVDKVRAVILAAIACEVRAQDFLRACSTQDNQPLVDLILAKGSGLHYYLHTALKAISGLSLKESDPALFKHVETLASNRNSLAHEGILSDRNPMLVAAPEIAQRVFDWFEERGR